MTVDEPLNMAAALSRSTHTDFARINRNLEFIVSQPEFQFPVRNRLNCDIRARLSKSGCLERHLYGRPTVERPMMEEN
jgi:hypothetical protein